MNPFWLWLKRTFNGENLRKVFLTTLPYVLAFLLPMLLAVDLFRQNGYFPFDQNGHSLAMIDMQGQYIPFFRYYKQLLAGDVDLFYTLGKVLGGDMLSIFLYYLASPFNLLVVFVSNIDLPIALIWIVILKLSTAGLTSFIVLNKLHKNTYVNLIFSIAYALIAYNFVYYSNIMWLDGVLALPLVALGIIHIVRDKSILLYVFSLTYVLTTSWYIGIMVCLFSVFFFITNYFSELSGSVTKTRSLVKFTIASLVAGIASFAFWGTAIINIMGTKGSSSFTKLSTTIRLFYDAINIERGFIFGGYKGMSDITGQTVVFYVGAIPSILTLLFFVNPAFTIKKRLAVGVLFALYFLAFFNKGIDHLFHGGPAPNWFPGRYSFIFGFLIIFYGAKSFTKIGQLKWYSLLTPIVVYAALLVKIRTDGYVFMNQGIILFSAGLILIFFVYLIEREVWIKRIRTIHYRILVKRGSLSLLTFFLLILSMSNVYSNNDEILKRFDETLRHQTMTSYIADEKLTSAFDYIKDYDDSLYRVEKSFIRQGTYNNANNDALYYGYNGLSHYSSSEKKSTMNYLKKIGYQYNGFNLNYANGSTLAMNAYLGVKFILDKGRNVNLDFVSHLDSLPYTDEDGVKIYQNDYALPFLFPIRSSNYEYVSEGRRINNNETYWFDMFEYQNSIFKTMVSTVVDEFGIQKDIFKRATYTKTLANVAALSDPFTYETSSTGALVYQIDYDQNANYYYYFHTRDTRDLFLYENGSSRSYFSYHSYQVNGLRQTGPTGQLAVRIDAPKAKVYVQEAIYYEDLAVLEEYIAAIKAQAGVDLKQETTSHYAASVTTNNPDQMMLLTLPYDRNFRIFVDGKKIESFTRFNIFTGFTIKNPGVHHVVIKYVQPSFMIGIPLMFISLSATVGAILVLKRGRRKEH